MNLVDVQDLKVHFPLANGDVVRAVDGVTFRVAKGASFGIVGESGSGKSTTAQALMRLVDPAGGAMSVGGHNLGGLSGEPLRRARKDIQMVFQDPFSSLNPRLRAGQAVREPLDLMGIAAARNALRGWMSCFALWGCTRMPSGCSRISFPAVSGKGFASPARW